MAFSASNLFKVNDLGSGRTLWHYVTADTAATVDSVDYFNGDAAYGGAYYQMSLGDWILAEVDTGGTRAWGYFVINSKASGSLDTAAITAYTSTDTD